VNIDANRLSLYVESHRDGPRCSSYMASPTAAACGASRRLERYWIWRLLDLDVPTPRMGLTEEPTQIWEIPEPVPFEFPLPSHEPAVPDLEPVHARA
jgi:hypothetical protein